MGANKDNAIALNSLRASDGWKLVEEWLDSQCEALQKAINTLDADSNKVIYNTKDIQIINLNILTALKTMPERRAAYYEQAESVSEELTLDGMDFRSII